MSREYLMDSPIPLPPVERRLGECLYLVGCVDIKFYVSAKAAQFLTNKGLRTISEVAAKTKAEVRSICNFEEENVKNIEKALAHFGFSFKPES